MPFMCILNLLEFGKGKQGTARLQELCYMLLYEHTIIKEKKAMPVNRDS